jgi:hypothetical protein
MMNIDEIETDYIHHVALYALAGEPVESILRNIPALIAEVRRLTAALASQAIRRRGGAEFEEK